MAGMRRPPLFFVSRRRCFVIMTLMVAVTLAMYYQELRLSTLPSVRPKQVGQEIRRAAVEEAEIHHDPAQPPDMNNNSSSSGSSSGSSRSDAQLSLAPEKPAQPTVPPKPHCPEIPVIAQNKVDLNLTEVTYEDVARKYADVLKYGGSYSPPNCTAQERLALIIPYRDREHNLYILLNNLIPFLIRQQLSFTIFLVQQTEDYRFNRCLMFNVGFLQSQKMGDYSCYILHDTDLIPRDNRNLYRCHPQKPRHLMLSRSNENWKETLPYKNFLGGVLALRKEHVLKINGCSNMYYGWGVEDDDLMTRLRVCALYVVRYPIDIGSYYSLHHDHQADNPQRGQLVKTMRKRMTNDGLNSINYTLVTSLQRQLFTWLLVKPPPPPTLL